MFYAFLLSFIFLFSEVYGFSFGYSPNYYRSGDQVDLLVNKVESDHTQLPYGYYDLSFVCPNNDRKQIHLSLGEILKGERFIQSNYDLKFGIDQHCVRLCDVIAKNRGVSKAHHLVKNGYVVHWSLDGLPGATTFVSGKNKYYSAGFPMGFVEDEIAYIYNHVMLVIRYHKEKNHPGVHTIVGFEVYPKSVINEECPGNSKSYKNLPLMLKKDESGSEQLRIPYTYSVYWREDSTIDYDSRWDLFYENDTHNPGHQIHFLAITNSVVILFLLSSFVAVVLLKTLKKDIQRSSPPLPTSEVKSDQTWRYLSNEVLQSPKWSILLSVLVGSGIQALVCGMGVLFLYVINTKLSFGGSSSRAFFMSHQGTFFSFSTFCLVTSGSVSSYLGIMLHKLFKNNFLNTEYSFKKIVVLSTIFSGLLPGFLLSIVLLLNFFLWAKKSSNALPFGTIVVLLLLLFVEVPLGIFGGYFGNKKKFNTKSFLLSTSRVLPSKLIRSSSRPKFAWLFDNVAGTFLFGILPFGVVYVELLFILNSVWLEKTKYYYMYGFLLLTAIVSVLTVCESTIVAIYISLSIFKNPKWHWLAFRIGSSLGWYIFAYSIYYFFSYLHVRDIISIILYFSYMALVSVVVGIAFGAVGVTTGLLFIKRIYGLLKED